MFVNIVLLVKLDITTVFETVDEGSTPSRHTIHRWYKGITFGCYPINPGSTPGWCARTVFTSFEVWQNSSFTPIVRVNEIKQIICDISITVVHAPVQGMAGVQLPYVTLGAGKMKTMGFPHQVDPSQQVLAMMKWIVKMKGKLGLEVITKFLTDLFGES